MIFGGGGGFQPPNPTPADGRWHLQSSHLGEAGEVGDAAGVVHIAGQQHVALIAPLRAPAVQEGDAASVAASAAPGFGDGGGLGMGGGLGGPVLPYLFLMIQCLVPFCAPYPTASTAWLMFSGLQLVS